MSQRSQSASLLSRIAFLSALIGVSGTALAQDADRPLETNPTESQENEAQRIVESRDSAMSVTLDLRAAFYAEADFDTPVGEIESTTYGAKVGLMFPIDDRARFQLSFGADITDYNITPVAGAVGTTAATVGAQFDSVLEYGVDAMYFRSIDDERSYFVGGGIGIAAEGGADDALTWNALGGFAIQSSPNFRWGLGIGVFSQIEDDVRVLPLPQIYIGFDEYWSLESMGPGLKLNYKWSDDLSMGVLAQFDGKSFRVDDDNTLVPDGAVKITGVPISYYMDYSGGESSRISLFAQVGVVLGGSMEILNSTGNTVVDEDIDASVFAGLGLKIAF